MPDQQNPRASERTEDVVKLTDVRLVVRRRCEVCDGTGEVRSEDWEAFEAWNERRSSGGTPEDFFLDVQRMDAVPPMNRECGACEDGWVDGDLDVEVLVNAILDRAPTTLIPPAELHKVADDLRASIVAAAQRSRGLADPENSVSYLQVVQEGAEALRSIEELIVRRPDA